MCIRDRAWWKNTGSGDARAAAARRNGYTETFDPFTYFLHDVPEEVVRAGESEVRQQAESIFAEPCRFEAWPNIPIRVVAGTEDRFFPIDFQTVSYTHLTLPTSDLV